MSGGQEGRLNPSFLTTQRGRTCLLVHLQPRASKDEIVGAYGNTLKIRITAPPLENRANRALVEFLADLLSLPKDRLEIVSGGKTRLKMVAVTGLTPKEVLDRLAQHLVGCH